MPEQYYPQDEISLKELLTNIWNERKLVLLITILVIALAAIYSFFIAKPIYEATSELIIQSPSTASTLYGTYTFPSENPKDYINYIQSNDVAKKVIDNEKLESTISGFQKSIKIDQDKEANRFLVTTSANDAKKAASINRNLVSTFIDMQRLTYKKYAIEDFINSYKRNINATEFSIESQERLLNERKKLLASIPPIYTLQKSLFNDPETAAAYADKFDLDLNTLSQAMLVAEHAKNIYLSMEETCINTESSLIDTKESLRKDKTRLAELEEEKVLIEQALTDGNLEVALNGKADVFYNKIMLVSPALEPTKPVAPRKAMNLAIGGVLGLMLGIFAALFINYWKNN